jgi:ubiquinone/menaquinone biosynthesis C-methylase UbiE
MNISRRKSLPALLFFLFFFQAAILACQTTLEEYGESHTNERQPPHKVMAAIGVKAGMVIGEVGAGRGRYTVQLAAKVGAKGKVYAEDIDRNDLDRLRERCRRNGISNIDVIVGDTDNPHFPQASLDLVFMVLTYHHLADPVGLLRNLIPSLKPEATVVVVDPDKTKDPGRPASEYTSEEKITKEAGQAGFELVRIEPFLPKDNIYILRVKTS